VSENLLPFEKRLFDLEESVRQAPSEEVRAELAAKLEVEREHAYARMSAWERVQLARHSHRPRMLDYTRAILDDLVELHGDRAVGDDPAMVCGIGRFQGETIFVLGQQKGVGTDEKVRRNFGMAHPEGYRKALRVLRLAERFRRPVVTFVDTPAAHPGIEAEQRGQGSAIAHNLLAFVSAQVPIYSVILSEGGSGGALAIAVGDWVAMFEHAVYMICPPERCAEILWRDAGKKEQAATALRGNPKDLHALGIVDEVLPEPHGGAHRDPAAAAETLRGSLAAFMEKCHQGRCKVEVRREKFNRMGRWIEDADGGAD